MIKKFIGALVILIALSTSALAGPTIYNPSWGAKYQKIWALGEAIGYLETLLAIATQETKLGEYGRTQYGIVGDTTAKFGDRSYGLCQVKLKTARDTLAKNPGLGSFSTDEHLLIALVTDDDFNLRIAAAYFQLMTRRFKTWREAVIAYNAGPTNARIQCDPQGYADKIYGIIKENRKFNVIGWR